MKIKVRKRLCPYIEKPFKDCYCKAMSSQDIERAVYLCSNNFERCEIYKKVNGDGNGSEDDQKLRLIKKLYETGDNR